MKNWYFKLFISLFLFVSIFIAQWYALVYGKKNIVVVFVIGFIVYQICYVIFHAAFSDYEKVPNKNKVGEFFFAFYRKKLNEAKKKIGKNILSGKEIVAVKASQMTNTNNVIKQFVHQRITESSMTVAQQDYLQTIDLQEKSEKLVITFDKKEFTISKAKTVYKEGAYFLEKVGVYQEKPIFNFLLINNKVFQFSGIYGKNDLAKQGNYVVYEKLFYQEVPPHQFINNVGQAVI